MKQHWSNKDWNPEVPIETRFKTLLADWKRKNSTESEGIEKSENILTPETQKILVDKKLNIQETISDKTINIEDIIDEI